MHLVEMEIKNFLGIGKGRITFSNDGLTLIEGINHDSPSSKSNGAGKSSIPEALFWVLYGKTKRGLSGDDVINNRASKGDGVKVELLFKIGDEPYKLVRARDDKNYGTGLFLYWMKKGPEFEDLTKGTVKETQKVLEELIKCQN